VTWQRVQFLALSLWWGSLTVLGAVYVPIIFAKLPIKSMAGALASHLFSAQMSVGVVCAAVFLGLTQYLRKSEENTALPIVNRASDAMNSGVGSVVGAVITAALLALLIEFAIAPRIIERDNLALWHGLGTAMFVAQWACVGWALWRSSAQRYPSHHGF
jgi:hypothetical protein